MKPKLCLLFLVLITSITQAQGLEFSGSIHAEGLSYSGDKSPFWMHTNRRGRIDKETNIAGWANLKATYYLSQNAYLEVGLGGLYKNGVEDDIFLDESFISFQNTWIAIVAGRKQKPDLYNGLSVSNQSILWSLNARPLPGVQIYTPNIYLNGEDGLGFNASLEEYILNDDRYVENAHIHHKSFHIVYKFQNGSSVSLGLQDFAQWAGTSPVYGKLGNSFSDYVDVFIGKESQLNEVDAGNAIGNHIGSYELKIKTDIKDYKVQFIYNSIFEDKSGLKLGNLPDGRYSVYFEDAGPFEDKWIMAFMYELYYTKDQSDGRVTVDGDDNYFNNNTYRSGWTYESRVLGLPFIGVNDDGFRINNSQVVAHHLGLSGFAFHKIPYRLLTSYRMNYGAKGSSFRRNKIFSSYINVQLWKDIVNVNVEAGADFISNNSPNFAAGLQISRTLF